MQYFSVLSLSAFTVFTGSFALQTTAIPLKTAIGGMAILLSFVTFGIYGIYWNYKLGKKLTGSGTLYLILSLIGLGIVNYILGQSEINKYIEKSANSEQIAA